MSEVRRDKTPVRQPTGKPTAKVGSATIGGAVITVVAFVFSMLDVEIDPAISAAVATVVVFLVGYFKKNVIDRRFPPPPVADATPPPRDDLP